MRVSKLTDEEKKRNRAISNARYRLKKGHVPGAVGRRPKDEVCTTEVINGVAVVTKGPHKINFPKELPENPDINDMKRFVMKMIRNAAEIGSAPAMIAAAQLLQKEIDRWERSRPPEIIPPKPRPRIPVEVEIEKVRCPHCGKEFEV